MWKNKLRVGLGVIIVAFLLATLIGGWISFVTNGKYGFYESYRNIGCILLAGTIMYFMIELLRWCFKPLEDDE